MGKAEAVIIPQHHSAQLACPVSTETRVDAGIVFRTAPLTFGENFRTGKQCWVSSIFIRAHHYIVTGIFDTAGVQKFCVRFHCTISAQSSVDLLVRPATDEEDTSVLRIHALQEEQRQEHAG